jgi:hypothetical protein
MARDYSKLTPDQILRLAKDPGNRSKIPTRYLPTQYKSVRVENARRAAPITPGSSYTVGQAEKERNATVDQKYGAAIRESQGVTKAIPQWYDNFRQQMQIAQQARQAGVQQGIQAYSQLQAGTAAPTAQANQAVQSYGQEATALGGVADPAAQQRAAQAAQIRGAATGDLGSVLAAQNAAQTSYGASQYANTGQSQLEALQKELGNMQELNLSKGQFATQTDADIKAREHKNTLEDLAFQNTAANTAADNQLAGEKFTADESYRERKLRIDRENSASKPAGPGGEYTAEEWAGMSTEARRKAWTDHGKATRAPGSGSGSAAKPATPAQRNTANTQITRARNWAQQYHDQHRPRADARRVLINGSNAASSVDEKKYQDLLGKGVKPVDARRRATVQSPSIPAHDELYADVAVDIAYDGHVSRRNAQRLHSMGLSVRDLGLPSYTSTKTQPGPQPRTRNAPSSRRGQTRPT